MHAFALAHQNAHEQDINANACGRTGTNTYKLTRARARKLASMHAHMHTNTLLVNVVAKATQLRTATPTLHKLERLSDFVTGTIQIKQIRDVIFSIDSSHSGSYDHECNKKTNKQTNRKKT